jgi:IS5 family transposase
MRVKTSQETSFSDMNVRIPESELDVLKKIINWPVIEKVLTPLQGDYSALSLFRMMLLQTWYNLSDAKMAEAMNRDLVFIRFCGFSLEGNKPDAATLCRFRNRLNQGNYLDSLLSMINKNLEAHDLKLMNGKYVSSDATLIQSSRRPKKVIEENQADKSVEVTYSDDKEATWLKKGDQLIYGYSANVVTDEAGLVEAVVTFPANRSEMTRLEEVLQEANLIEGQVLLYDKGVDSQANRNLLKARGIKDGIMRKKPKGGNLSYWARLKNRLIGRRRFVVERTFGTLKRTYGLHRARYLGLKKVNAEVKIKSIAYNIKRGLNQYIQRLQDCYA